MRWFFVALSLAITGLSFSSAQAQRPSHFPQKHRDTDMPTLLRAAYAGDSEAMLWLGVRYSNGPQATTPKGYQKDPVQAAIWYQKAADAGQASGMFFTGTAFWGGRGVAQDFVEAYKWLDLSAKHGNATERDRAVSARDGLARVMTPQQITEAKDREASWEKDFQQKKRS